mmetsp:Transcript_44004/g.138876  ORF Transcript_44004/g.138876 Transcript_44004/m.138876 type:complete len:167 (+) Transcript_44004:293-793(+)
MQTIPFHQHVMDNRGDTMANNKQVRTKARVGQSNLRSLLSAGMVMLVLKIVLYASAPPPVEAYNICTCQCCYSGICIDRPNSEEWNGTFRVPGCSFCTKSLCFEHIKKPIGSCDEVSATCVDYDTYWRLTVILLILFLLASLLVIGCLRDVPVVKKVFKLGEPGGK